MEQEKLYDIAEVPEDKSLTLEEEAKLKKLWKMFSSFNIKSYINKDSEYVEDFISWSRIKYILMDFGYIPRVKTYLIKSPVGAGFYVKCFVTIDNITRSTELPVYKSGSSGKIFTDNNINVWEVQNTKLRAFVRCIAENFGLGIHLYMGFQKIYEKMPELTI